MRKEKRRQKTKTKDETKVVLKRGAWLDIFLQKTNKQLIHVFYHSNFDVTFFSEHEQPLKTRPDRPSCFLPPLCAVSRSPRYGVVVLPLPHSSPPAFPALFGWCCMASSWWVPSFGWCCFLPLQRAAHGDNLQPLPRTTASRLFFGEGLPCSSFVFSLLLRCFLCFFPFFR